MREAQNAPALQRGPDKRTLKSLTLILYAAPILISTLCIALAPPSTAGTSGTSMRVASTPTARKAHQRSLAIRRDDGPTIATTAYVRASARAPTSAIAPTVKPLVMAQLGPAPLSSAFIPAGSIAKEPTNVQAEKPKQAMRTPPAAWRMQHIKSFTIDDNGLITADGQHLQLEGLNMPGPDESCKRLDGVSEPCLKRAANRLELVTRGRTVTCRITAVEEGPSPASCKADKTDLATDLLNSGLAKRLAGSPALAPRFRQAAIE